MSKYPFRCCVLAGSSRGKVQSTLGSGMSFVLVSLRLFVSVSFCLRVLFVCEWMCLHTSVGGYMWLRMPVNMLVRVYISVLLYGVSVCLYV